MIAALCAYDDQLLGKVLTQLALDYSGVDLACETQARRSLEQRIRMPDYFWTSRLIHVLDQLAASSGGGGPPERDTATRDWDAPSRWGNELELQDYGLDEFNRAKESQGLGGVESGIRPWFWEV